MTSIRNSHKTKANPWRDHAANIVLLVILFAMIRVSVRRGNDFHVFWMAGDHARSGQPIYRPEDHWMVFKYFPAWAVFMSGFSILPEKLGVVLFNGVQLGFWWFAAKRWAEWLIDDLAKPVRRLVLMLLALSAMSAEIGYGQVNGFLFWGATQLFVWLEGPRQRPVRAGVLMSILVSIKLNFAVLGVYCLMRNLRTGLGMLIGLLGLHLIVASYFYDPLGLAVYKDWLQLLLTQSSDQYYIFESQGFLRFFHSLIGDAAIVAWAATVMAFVAGGAWLNFMTNVSPPWRAAYWLAGTYLVSPLAWWYQILFMYPLVFLLLRESLPPIQRRAVVACLGIYALFTFNILGRDDLLRFKEWQGFFVCSLILLAIFLARLIHLTAQRSAALSCGPNG